MKALQRIEFIHKYEIKQPKQENYVPDKINLSQEFAGNVRLIRKNANTMAFRNFCPDKLACYSICIRSGPACASGDIPGFDERKFLAWLTIRKGPNRVGPNGFLQTFADAIKLLFKEDIMSKDTNKVLFTLAPIIAFVPVMVIYGLMPFTEHLVAINLAVGLFLVFALSSVTTVGIVLAGWSSNNKYSLLGGMRSAAQAISYEIPLVVAVLSVAVLAGSLNLMEIVKAQEGGLFHWNIVPAFIGFVVLFICSMPEVNSSPFDCRSGERACQRYNTGITA